MIETHPFKPFVPKDTKYIILGGFTSKDHMSNLNYDFYYCNGRNHFWPIIEKVYDVKLETTEEKKFLLTNLHIAIADIIYQCERKQQNSADTSLVNFIYSNTEIENIFRLNPIEKVYLTSKFVEDKFRKNFAKLIQEYPEAQIITLPSPSPRYAAMSKDKKVEKYREYLPKLV